MVLVHCASSSCILSPSPLVLFSSTCPHHWTYNPTFPLHCPMTDSSLYCPVKIGKRVTWDHLSTWWTARLGQPSWGTRINIRMQTASGQHITDLNRIGVFIGKLEKECSGWAITECKRGWETSLDIMGPRGERVQMGKKEGMSKRRMLAPVCTRETDEAVPCVWKTAIGSRKAPSRWLEGPWIPQQTLEISICKSFWVWEHHEFCIS